MKGWNCRGWVERWETWRTAISGEHGREPLKQVPAKTWRFCNNIVVILMKPLAGDIRVVFSPDVFQAAVME